MVYTGHKTGAKPLQKRCIFGRVMLRFFTFGKLMVFAKSDLPYLLTQKWPKSGKVMLLTRQGYA
jgi:hypothetical protein